MNVRPPLASLVESLAANVPFVAPDAIERRSGRPLRLRLGANESLFGPSPRAAQAMRVAIERVAHYGDPESAALRAELSTIHGVPPSHLVVTSGIDDLLGLAVRAFIDRDAVAVTSLGGYPTFGYHVLGFGGRLDRVPYRDDFNDLPALSERAHKSNARLVYLANPDNPSGTWHSAAAIRDFSTAFLPTRALLGRGVHRIRAARNGSADRLRQPPRHPVANVFKGPRHGRGPHRLRDSRAGDDRGIRQDSPSFRGQRRRAGGRPASLEIAPTSTKWSPRSPRGGATTPIWPEASGWPLCLRPPTSWPSTWAAGPRRSSAERPSRSRRLRPYTGRASARPMHSGDGRAGGRPSRVCPKFSRSLAPVSALRSGRRR